MVVVVAQLRNHGLDVADDVAQGRWRQKAQFEVRGAFVRHSKELRSVLYPQEM